MNDATIRRLNVIGAVAIADALLLLVVVTLGPPGSLIGDLRIRREAR